MYISSITGLRGIAVISVIIYHFFENLIPNGYFGVDIFFVISGFVITKLILELHVRKDFSFKSFFFKRARRLTPALFFMLFLSLPISYLILLPPEYKQYSQSIFSSVFLLSNFLFKSQTGYFEADADLKPLLHTWSLSLEEQFYLIFPFLLIFALKHKKTLQFIVTLILVSYLLAIIFGKSNPESAFYLLHARAWEFLSGSLTYLISRNINNNHIKLNYLGIFLLFLSLLLPITDFSHPGLITLIPVLSTMVLLAYANTNGAINSILSSNPIYSVGKISYSLYLLHFPAIAYLHNLGKETELSFVFLSLSVVIILSILSYNFIEKPFRSVSFISNRKFTIYFTGAAVLLASIGIMGHTSDGAINRFETRDLELVTAHSYSKNRNYLRGRNDKHKLKPFPKSNNGKTNIVLIGDSFSQDLTNALYESNIIKNINLSTRLISNGCGNLFLDRNEDSLFAKNSPSSCITQDLFNDTLLKSLLLDADEVWFASKWHNWEVDLLNKSIGNLPNHLQKSYKIFSSKSYGDIKPRSYLKLSDAERYHAKEIPNNNVLEVNRIIQRTIPAENYIDLQSIACKIASCKVFDNELKLRSYDGYHLTPHGAKDMGRNLQKRMTYISKPLI